MRQSSTDTNLGKPKNLRCALTKFETGSPLCYRIERKSAEYNKASQTLQKVPDDLRWLSERGLLPVTAPAAGSLLFFSVCCGGKWPVLPASFFLAAWLAATASSSNFSVPQQNTTTKCANSLGTTKLKTENEQKKSWYYCYWWKPSHMYSSYKQRK